MKPLPTVFRFESFECSPSPYPTLAAAMRLHPQHCESQIVTSAHGVVLAEACPVNGAGSILQWALTLAGQDVVDRSGWQGSLSTGEVDAVLDVALGDELRVAS
jgi:hypothetical protein